MRAPPLHFFGADCRFRVVVGHGRPAVHAALRLSWYHPLFRSAVGKTGMLTDKPMNRIDAYRMVRRRTADAGFKVKLGCHVFRATGITAYLEAGGTLENAQAMAAHESPRTTKLYDRTGDEITLDEVERITI
jgi:integrase